MTYHFKNTNRRKMIRNLTKSEKQFTHRNDSCLKLKNCANSVISENEKENTTNIISNENIFGFEKEKRSGENLRKRKVQGKELTGREVVKRPKILNNQTISEKELSDQVSNSHCMEPSVNTIDFERNKNRIAEMKQEYLEEEFPLNNVFNRRGSLDSQCNSLKGSMEEDSENTFLDIEINTPKVNKPSYETAEVPDIELPSVLNGVLLSCRVIDRSSGLEMNISPCLVCEEKVQSFSSTKDDRQPTTEDNFHSCSHTRGYHFIKLLRDCIYGKVYLAKSLDWSEYYQQFVFSEDSPLVAIKCIDRSKIDYSEFKLGGTGGEDKKVKGVVKTTTAEDAIREISLLQLVSSPGHKNVQSVTDVIMDINCVYLISPYYSGGELFNHVDNILNKHKQRLPQEQVKKYMREILEGVKYLHRETKICHHDLSLENILLDEKGSPVIIDFGMACKLPRSTDKGNLRDDELLVETAKSTFDENPSDNLSIVTDRGEFFDFDEPGDLILRPSARNGETFYQQLSGLLFGNSKPKVKLSCSVRSDSSRSTLSGDYLHTVLERVSTPETIVDAGMSGIMPSESSDVQTSFVSQNFTQRKLKIKSRGARIGKITYMTPEIWNNEDFDGEAIDMWACGIILFILLVGFPPMEEPSEKDHRFTMIMNGELYVLLKLWGIGPDIVPTEALDLINKLVRRNPWERLSVEEALVHPYLL